MLARAQDRTLVSVVIPYYNGRRFLSGAIESVLVQSCSPVEIIVVDDGSSEPCDDIVSGYESTGVVRLERHQQNRGIAAARNTGVRAASSEYVAFLDQDDVWLPHKLSVQLPVLLDESRGVDLVFSDVVVENPSQGRRYLAQHGYVPSNIERLDHATVLRELFVHNFVTLITVTVRKQRLFEVGLFDETIKGGEVDFDICLRLAEKCRMSYVDEPLAIHRLHENNFSADKLRLMSDAPRIVEKAVERAPFLTEFVPLRTARNHHRLARHYRDAGELTRARQEFRRAIQCAPTWIAPYLSYGLCCLGPIGTLLVETRRSARAKRILPVWHPRGQEPRTKLVGAARSELRS